MSYAIENNGKIIDTVTSENGLLEYVKNIYPNAVHIPFITINDLENDINYKMGFYIINNGTEVQLVEKIKEIKRGIIYNTYNWKIIVKNMWTMYKIEVPKKITTMCGDLLDNNNTDQINYTNYKNYNILSTPNDSFFDLPLILSIGKSELLHKQSVQSIIDKIITTGNFMKENLIIMTGNSNNQSWIDKYVGSFVYDGIDDDIMYYIDNIIEKKSCNVKSIRKLIVFDNCNANKMITNPKMISFLKKCRNKKLGVIIMTSSTALICPKICENLDYLMIPRKIPPITRQMHYQCKKELNLDIDELLFAMDDKNKNVIVSLYTNDKSHRDAFYF